MKRKLLLASVAIATVLASCTKEEIVNVDNQLQELGNRPMVEAPVATIGNAGTKMTTSGVYAGVKWEAGDGFGAAVMDIYNGDEDADFEDKFTIVPYINSNVLFATEDGTTFRAEASMPEGNHLFYAPFNKANISRKALATQLPLEQVVANPSANAAAPSNDIITAFYEDGTSPVFVAYEKIDGEAKTSLDLLMRHIYSLPLVTLKLGDKVVVVDENGVRNQVEVEENGKKVKKDVYESEITIDKIVFVNEMPWKGSIVNTKIATKLGEDEDGNIVWDATKYEDAKTEDIVTFDDLDTKKKENIVVKFDGGQELTAEKNGYFFMVLPGKEYNAATLEIKVYATINGKQYVSKVNPTPAKNVRLLPGLPYSADEYNQDGTMKDSKGTSMTYVVDGDFLATDDPAAITGYNAIENYDDLTNFITKVAYRGEKLEEITKAEAEKRLENKTYDAQKYFVITADEDAPIVLDDAFVAAFKKSCVISGESASMTFLARDADNINLVWGDLTWNDEARSLFSFKTGHVYVKGNVKYEAEKTNGGFFHTLDGATFNLNGDGLTEVINDANAIVNVNSEGAHTVTSTAGTVNVLVSTKATIVNDLADNEDHTALVSKSTLNIADGVTMETPVANNSLVTTKKGVTTTHYAEVNVNNAIATIANNGNITVNSNKAKLTVTGTGNVNNTIGGVVTNNENNVIYANVTTFKNLGTTYDDLCGLNMLNVSGCVEHDLASALKTTVKTINFNAGSSLAMGAATWDWTKVENININADVTWTGRHTTKSVIKVEQGAIKVGTYVNSKGEVESYKFNVVDINVHGYQRFVADAAQLDEAIAEGETNIHLTSGTYTIPAAAKGKALKIVGTKDVVIDATYSYGQSISGANIAFEGVTIKGQTSGNYAGFTHVEKMTFTDCVFEGKLTNYSNTEFINCTFNNKSDYAVWTSWGGTEAKFVGCTFNSGGKALLVYGGSDGNKIKKVYVQNCVFNSDKSSATNKAAIETGDDYTAEYTIEISNTTVSNNFSVTTQNKDLGGTSLGTKVWGNKDLMPSTRLNVIIDGINVY